MILYFITWQSLSGNYLTAFLSIIWHFGIFDNLFLLLFHCYIHLYSLNFRSTNNFCRLFYCLVFSWEFWTCSSREQQTSLQWRQILACMPETCSRASAWTSETIWNQTEPTLVSRLTALPILHWSFYFVGTITDTIIQVSALCFLHSTALILYFPRNVNLRKLRDCIEFFT